MADWPACVQCGATEFPTECVGQVVRHPCVPGPVRESAWGRCTECGATEFPTECAGQWAYHPCRTE